MLQSELTVCRPASSISTSAESHKPTPAPSESQPSAKKARVSLFSHYKNKLETTVEDAAVKSEKQLQNYLEVINSSSFNADECKLKQDRIIDKSSVVCLLTIIITTLILYRFNI
ncbi:hypothetical protein Btru_075623 [Bulinus truncatus]|nr:hypothetical protein Btru_075623 [Bulinus truncatus]